MQFWWWLFFRTDLCMCLGSLRSALLVTKAIKSRQWFCDSLQRCDINTIYELFSFIYNPEHPLSYLAEICSVVSNSMFIGSLSRNTKKTSMHNVGISGDETDGSHCTESSYFLLSWFCKLLPTLNQTVYHSHPPQRFLNPLVAILCLPNLFSLRFKMDRDCRSCKSWFH